MSTPSVLIAQTGLNTSVTEGGATDSYTVVLSEAPTADVTIALDNTNRQVTSDAATLIFTTTNWAIPQTVTVTAVNDTTGEGRHTGVIRHSVTSSGSNYDGVAIDNVIVAVTDNDLAAGLRNYPFITTFTNNPFGLTDVGGYAHPTFVDIDSDGDLDGLFGNQAGNTLFFQNTGTAGSATFAAAVTNPFGLANVGTYANPAFADIDGDGDLDAFLGNKAGDTLFFQNTGTGGGAAFAAAVTNPFGFTNVGIYASPTFGDIDGDGDLDAFIGNRVGDTLFFENTGTASSAAFSAPVTNPFGLTRLISFSSPTLVDIDGDGDLDAFIKNVFFKNTGSVSSAAFATGVTNPFNLSPAAYPNPTFADIDGDGDFDVFFGTSDGNTSFYLNAPVAPTITGLNADSSGWAGVGSTVLLDKFSNATVDDLEMDIAGWNSARLTVQRVVGATLTPLSSDLFSFSPLGFTVSGADLQTAGSTTFATFTSTNGVLTIDFNASATNALVRDVIRGILYRNDTPTGDTSIRFALRDNEAQTATADVKVASNSIYVTNSTDSATIDVSNGVSFSEAVAVAATMAGNQTLVLDSALSTTLAANLSLGESIIVNADAVVSGTALSGSTVTIGSGFTLSFTNAVGKAATIASVLAGAGAMTKTGSGSLTLSGANTYTGNTTVSAGGLATGAANIIADTSAVSVSSGATLTLGGAETIGSLTSAGAVALGSYTLTTGAKNTSTTFSGIVSGAGGLTKIGSGTFTLSGTNAYTGNTTVSAGGLTTSGAARIADTSAVSVASGATFTIGGAETIGSLAGAGNVALGSNTLTAGGDNTSTTVSGVISGSGGLAKAGGGVLTLSGTDTYSGATSLNAGTLTVNGALSNTSSVTVASGATLGGTGSIGTVGVSGTVTVQSGGTLAPGGSPGSLTLNKGLTVASGGTVSMELNGTTPGSGHDRIVVKGSVTLSSATLATSLGFTPTLGDSFTLIDNDGSDAVTGTFAGLAEGAHFLLNGKSIRISYVGGDGNDIVLTVISAPATIAGVSSSTANGSYKAGDTLAITMQFSEAVTVAGTPQLALETGSIDRTANYASGSGSDTLTFNYTVQAGDTSADLDYLSSAALALNGGTIQNGSSVDANLTLAAPGAASSLGANRALLIDTTAPTTTIASVALSADTGTSAADFITQTAAQTISGTLSANLAADEIVQVSLDNGATWATASATVGQSAWSLAGQTLGASDTLKVRLADAAGNTGAETSQAYVLDTSAPTATIASAAFSADTGASAADFITQTAAQTISGTLSANVAAGEIVQVSLDNGATWATASATAGQSAWSLAGQTLGASDTLKVRLADAAGNTGAETSQAYVLDTTAPTANVAGSSPVRNATGVPIGDNIIVRFSEALNPATDLSKIYLKDVATGTLAPSAITLDGGGHIVINPNADLRYSSAYYVSWDANALLDAAGNSVTAVLSSDKTTYNFTTAAAPAGGDPTPAPVPTPTPDPVPPPDPVPTPTPDPVPPPTPPAPDTDGVPAALENAAPGLPPKGGGAPVAGDGNGDGVADSQQSGVTSVAFLSSTTAQTNPGNASSVFVTLVASSVDGKIDSHNAGNATLSNVHQLDAPANLPAQIKMPLGLIAFSASVPSAGQAESFSLYLDPALGANGYWKSDSTGTWVNLASAVHGGRVVTESGKTRLDFKITDGGQFDADGKADGVITDPGAAGFMPLSLVGYAPALPNGTHFWF